MVLPVLDYSRILGKPITNILTVSCSTYSLSFTSVLDSHHTSNPASAVTLTHVQVFLLDWYLLIKVHNSKNKNKFMVKCNLILCFGNLFSPSSAPLLLYAYKIYKNPCQTPNFTCSADICQVHRKSVGGRHLTRLSIFIQSSSKIINQFPLAPPAPCLLLWMSYRVCGSVRFVPSGSWMSACPVFMVKNLELDSKLNTRFLTHGDRLHTWATADNLFSAAEVIYVFILQKMGLYVHPPPIPFFGLANCQQRL